MKKYNFLKNVNKHMEQEKKKEEIGKILSSLQRPFKQVIQSVCENQQIQVNELYKSLGWKK